MSNIIVRGEKVFDVIPLNFIECACRNEFVSVARSDVGNSHGIYNFARILPYKSTVCDRICKIFYV